MKNCYVRLPSFKLFLAIVCGVASLWAAPVKAVPSYYWDINGPVSGSGGSGSPSGSWEGTNWATQSGGNHSTGVWLEGSFPRFCASSDATGVYTVSATAAHSISGVYNITGSTILNGAPLSFVYADGLAGLLVANSLTVSNILADSGGPCQIETEVASTGSLYLYGPNTFSGGTVLGNLSGAAGAVYFGNNAAFGTGLIQMSSSGGTLAAIGNGAYAISNAVDMANVTITLTGTPAGVTFSGAWDTGGTGPCTLSLGGAASNLVRISGVMSDSQGFIKAGAGTLVLSGNNTYGSGSSTRIAAGLLLLANTAGSATGSSFILVSNTAATLSGSGSATGTVDNFGAISATNLSGGTAALGTGSQIWENGGTYPWAVNNTTGTAGTVSGWDLLTVNGALSIPATSSAPFTINLVSLTAAGVQGALAGFDNTRDYSWLILHSTVAPISGFSTANVVLNTSSFANAISGNSAFSVSTNNTGTGYDLYVNLAHTPSLTVSNVTVAQGSNAVFNAVNTIVGSSPATASYSWKSNGVPLTDGGRISGSSTATLTIANAQQSDDATYLVTAVNAAGSGFASATLTVTSPATTISWATPNPILYGTPLGSNQLDATANVAGSFNYTPVAGTILNSGTYKLSVVFTPSVGGYSSATNSVNLIVSPAPLTITASNAVRPSGAANPVFTGSIAGLVNGDNISASYNSSATSSSPVGAYSIVPAVVDPNNRSTNYTVTLVNGTLDVGAVVTFSSPAPIVYGTPLGSNQLDATADVSGTFAYTPANGAILTVGTHVLTVVFTPADTADYNSVTNTASLVVQPAPLTVTAASVTRQVGTPNPVLTGSIIGLQNGDAITAAYSTTATSSSAAGTYAITPSLIDSNNLETNYTVNLINGTLTIIAAPAAVTATVPQLIPLPVTLQTRAGVFSLGPVQNPPALPAPSLLSILVDSNSLATGQYLAQVLARSTGYQLRVVLSASTNAVKNAILITTSNAIPTLGAEGYELTVAPDGVVIRAPAQSGTFYGVQTFLQLLPPAIYSPHLISGVAWVAPCVYVKDQPSYSWRGLMLDVSRHFFNKQEIKQVLDAMAMHKLNTFHWHLVDDQAWRLQITNYPALTVAGAFRAGIDYGLPPRSSTATNTAGQYGGYYTQADAQEIVAYAAQRHITVVPEIEMPCHSTAGLAAYPQFGCGNPVADYNEDYPNINYGVDLYSLGTPGTLAFLQDAIREVIGIFPSLYIHCGGDEVVASGDTQWNSYSYDRTNMIALGITPNGSASIVKYQHWFSTNMAAYIQSQGRVMMGWTEFENGGILTNAALTDWETGSSSQAVATAEAGQPVVMCPDNNCYINYVESANTNIEPPFIVGGQPEFLSLSTIYSYNPMPAALPSQYASNILGAQSVLFCEYVPSLENVQFKTYPRTCAMAELTWTPLAQQNYSSFTSRLATHEQRLTAMGVNYDHEAIPQIGSWGPTVSTSPSVLTWDISTNVTTAGEIDINFVYTGGGDGLSISSVALLVNGVQVDIDAHAGFAGNGATYTLYVLHLPETKPNATYTISATVAGSGGSSSTGVVFMPNWD